MKAYTLQWNGQTYKSCPALALVTHLSPTYIRNKANRHPEFELAGHTCTVSVTEIEDRIEIKKAIRKPYTFEARGVSIPLELVYMHGKLVKTIFL
jgi:hypothetical protein